MSSSKPKGSGARSSCLSWREALAKLQESLRDAPRQELLVARSELTQALATLTERLRSRGVAPAAVNEATEAAVMDDVVLHDLRQQGFHPSAALGSIGVDPEGFCEDASFAATVAEEMRKKRRRLTKKTCLSGVPEEGPGSSTQVDECEEAASDKAESAEEDEASEDEDEEDVEGSQASDAEGDEDADESEKDTDDPEDVEVQGAKDEESEKAPSQKGEQDEEEEEEEKEEEEEEKEEEEKEEEEEEEKEHEDQDLKGEEVEDETQTAGDDLEDTTVFVGKSPLLALRAKLEKGDEPSAEEVVRLFDVEALPEGEDLEVLDTSLLGEAWPGDSASTQAAAQALVSRLGPRAAAQLVVDVCGEADDEEEGEEEDEVEDDEVLEDVDAA